MLRTRRLLGAGGVVDHHCHTGAHCGSCAMNYMEHYAFIDRLWYGEGFDYGEATADFWLAEISGLPFGLGSDMLRYPPPSALSLAFPYRGMLVGSSHRGDTSNVHDPYSPTETWRLWDSFGIERADMVGWWEAAHRALPVVCNDSSVLVTTYMHAGKSALIVLAWFGAGNGTAPTNQPPSHVELRFDWSAIGINATTARLHAPHIAPSNPGLENFACHGVSPSRARTSTPQHHSTTLEYTIERTCLALHCLAPPHVFAARFVCLLS